MMTGARSTVLGAALAAALVCVLAAGCAIQVAPGGGPVDREPPRLAGVLPDSGSTGLGDGVTEIQLLFTEKMDPQPAERFFFSYPPLEIEETKWEGRRVARIRFAEPLPADTVLVFETSAALKDNHRVPSEETKRWPVATGDSLTTGIIAGTLRFDGKPLAKGVVELYAVPPDSVLYFTQDRLRRAETDSLGRFRFRWLPAPGGPWLIRAFQDANSDLRLGENEGRRLLPDEFALTDTLSVLNAGTTEIYGLQTPGMLHGSVDSTGAWTGRVWAWTERIAEEDTGFVPEALNRPPDGLTALTRGAVDTLREVGPGLVRAVFFVDADGDSLPGLMSALFDSTATGPQPLEPMAVLDSLEVEPGLSAFFTAPAFPDTLPLWLPPEPKEAATDSLTVAVPPDSLTVAPVDSLTAGDPEEPEEP